MLIHRIRCAALILLTSVTGAGTSRAADGAFDLSWNACAPVVKSATTTGGEIRSIFASVIGYDIPHKGYVVELEYANVAQLVPDAWRFDFNGCEGPSFVNIDHIRPDAMATTCPSFQSNRQSTQVKELGFVPPGSESGFPQTNMRVMLFNGYPSISSVNPATRYFLMRVEFDLTFAVVGPGTDGESCGGVEESICFKLARANYLGMDDLEHPFGRAPGPMVLTMNGPSACTGPTPAVARSWGRLKDQYR